MDIEQQKPIIIIGAGLVGLTLAQGLRKAGFPFIVYDRDTSINERPAGWGITVHWSLPSLYACLPEHLYNKIPSIQVDPEAGSKGKPPQSNSYHLRAGLMRPYSA